MNRPAARITDPTNCPTPGHGASAMASGSPDVFIEGLAAAREGDITACGSPLVSGLSSTVFINGRPAAMVGSLGEHGDQVLSGAGSVCIGDTFGPGPFMAPLPPAIGHSRSFLVTDSETGAPLARRDYVATAGRNLIKGKPMQGG